MASLRDLIASVQGRSPEREEKVRADAQAFSQKQDPEGKAPEEEGAEEADFIPSPQDEQGTMALKDSAGNTQKVPTLMGTAPFMGKMSGPSRIAILRESGMPEAKIAEAAENMRVAGSHTFLKPDGSLGTTVGQHSDLGQELKALGKANISKAEATTPGFDYRMRK
jgi:hypothetical protein